MERYKSTGRARRLVGGAAIVATLWSFSGCALSTRPGAETVGNTRSTLKTAPTPAVLSAQISERRALLKSFRAQARLRYHGPGNKFRSSQMILVNGNDHLRIDVMNPFGISYTVANNGDHLEGLDHRESRLYSGRSTAANVERMIGVPLNVETLTSLLRSLPPPVVTLDQGSVYGFEGNWIWHRGLGDKGQIEIAFDQNTSLVTSVKLLTKSGKESIKTEFSRYAKQPKDGRYPAVAHQTAVPMAERIKILFSDGGELQLDYERIWLDIEPSEDAFSIKVAGDTERINLDADINDVD